jgi:hypothetical protein
LRHSTGCDRDLRRFSARNGPCTCSRYGTCESLHEAVRLESRRSNPARRRQAHLAACVRSRLQGAKPGRRRREFDLSKHSGGFRLRNSQRICEVFGLLTTIAQRAPRRDAGCNGEGLHQRERSAADRSTRLPSSPGPESLHCLSESNTGRKPNDGAWRRACARARLVAAKKSIEQTPGEAETRGRTQRARARRTCANEVSARARGEAERLCPRERSERLRTCASGASERQDSFFNRLATE